MRISGFKIGSIFGIKIYIDFSWFIIFVLITWLLATRYFPTYLPDSTVTNNLILGIAASLLFFFSALVHEIAHSLVARRYGILVRKITLFLFGGVAEIFDEPKRPRDEFWISVVGPLTSLAIGLFFWALSKISVGFSIGTHFELLFMTLFQVNIMLTIFNLLPGFPLDGGRILRSVVWKMSGNLKKATETATNSGKFIAYLIMLWGILRIFTTDIIGGFWLVLIGLFLFQAASQSYLELLIKRALEHIKTRDLMERRILSVSPFISINDLIAEFMLRYGLATLPVIRDEKIVGTISLNDIRRHSDEIDEATRVFEVMREFKNNLDLRSDEEVLKGLKLMITENVSFIPVRDKNHLVGILTLDNIAKYLNEKHII